MTSTWRSGGESFIRGTTHASVIDRFRQALESGDHSGLADVYAPEALLDVNCQSGASADRPGQDGGGSSTRGASGVRTSWSGVSDRRPRVARRASAVEGPTNELSSRTLRAFDIVDDRRALRVALGRVRLSPHLSLIGLVPCVPCDSWVPPCRSVERMAQVFSSSGRCSPGRRVLRAGMHRRWVLATPGPGRLLT